MAMIGQIAIAMSVQTQQLKAGLGKSTAMIHKFEATASQAGGALKALFAGAAVYGAAKGLGRLISAGSDLAENMSKVQAVFGSGSKTVVDAADQMAAAFGTSKNEFLSGAAVLGGLFKGAGFDPDAAARMSVEFTKLAGDVASFANIPFDEAFGKLKAGLTGESEPLKSLGVLINEDRVKAQAMAMGLAKAGDTLSEQAKVQARAALIMGSLADAQGDLAKTANGVANASRGISGQIENLAATIGTALQPVVQSVLGDLNVAVSALALAWQDSGLAALGAGAAATGSAQAQSSSIGLVQASVMRVADAWTIVKLAGLGASSYLIKPLTALVDLVGLFARGLDLVLKSLGQAQTGAGKFFTDTAKGMEKFGADNFKAFQSGLKDYFEKPAASEAVASYFDKARAQIDATRKDLMSGPKASIPLATGAGAARPAKAADVKFATAMGAGSQEAVNTILRSRYGAGGGNKAADQTARNTAETTKAVRDLPTQMGEAIARAFSGGNPLMAFGNF